MRIDNSANLPVNAINSLDIRRKKFKKENTSHYLKNQITAVTQELTSTKDKLKSSDREKMKDPLTGLSNRNEAEILIKNMLLHLEHGDSSKNEGICLVIMDINDFKRVNDNYGHLKGDNVLKYVAKLLKERCRESDVVGRYGGEEFWVVFDNVPIEVAKREFGSIGGRDDNGEINNIEDSGFLKDINYHLSLRLPELLRKDSNQFKEDDAFARISAGYSYITPKEYNELNLTPEETIEYLIEKADKEMYQTKRRMKAKVGR